MFKPFHFHSLTLSLTFSTPAHFSSIALAIMFPLYYTFVSDYQSLKAFYVFSSSPVLACGDPSVHPNWPPR